MPKNMVTLKLKVTDPGNDIMNEAVKELDKDGDITLDEAKAIFKKVYEKYGMPWGPNDEMMVEYLFHDADKNGDGKIDV